MSFHNICKNFCASLFDIGVILLFHVIGIDNNFAIFVLFVSILGLPSELNTDDISLFLTIVGFAGKNFQKFVSISFAESEFVGSEVGFECSTGKCLKFRFEIITNSDTNRLSLFLDSLRIFPLSESFHLSALVGGGSTTHIEIDFIFVISTSVVVFGINGDLVEISFSSGLL